MNEPERAGSSDLQYQVAALVAMVAKNQSESGSAGGRAAGLGWITGITGFVAAIASLVAAIQALQVSSQTSDTQLQITARQEQIDKNQRLLDQERRRTNENTRIANLWVSNSLQCAQIPVDDSERWAGYDACMSGQGVATVGAVDYLQVDAATRIGCVKQTGLCK